MNYRRGCSTNKISESKTKHTVNFVTLQREESLMGILRGIICDGTSGALVEAKVHVLSSNGQFIHPSDSLLKIGPGDPFFL